MSKRTPVAFVGTLAIALAAVAAALFMQSRSASQGVTGAPAPVQTPGAMVAADVPESATVHEGPHAPVQYDPAETIAMKVYASPTCGCCGAWVEHAREHGFEVEVVHRQDMVAVKRALGLPLDLASCHTAVVNDYVVEGHVPADDLRRFLAEAPEVLGLGVPGMPVGSPGMEVPTGETDDYEVVTFGSEGQVGVFARHGPSHDG